jgi:hypothetical protein
MLAILLDTVVNVPSSNTGWFAKMSHAPYHYTLARVPRVLCRKCRRRKTEKPNVLVSECTVSVLTPHVNLCSLVSMDETDQTQDCGSRHLTVDCF